MTNPPGFAREIIFFEEFLPTCFGVKNLIRSKMRANSALNRPRTSHSIPHSIHHRPFPYERKRWFTERAGVSPFKLAHGEYWVGASY